MKRRLCYFINPAAGGGRALARWHRLRTELWHRGLAGREVISAVPGDTPDAARAAADTHDVLVAVGGDGQVGDVARGLTERPDSGARLGVLPLGSGNDAARMAGIGDMATAINALHEGGERRIDTMEVECVHAGQPLRRTALVVVGAGLAADIIEQVPRGLKRLLGGRFAYMAGFFLALRRYRPQPATVRCDEVGRTDSLAAVVVANHTHAGGNSMHIGPGGRPDDGWVEVSTIAGLGRLAVAGQFGRLLRGTHIGHPAVAYGRAQAIEITGPVELPIQADGELLGRTPARVRVRPASLRVVVPVRL